MHHKISLNVSPHQIRRLRKGLPTRVKKGEGFNLLVHPETYHLMTRAFNRGKGYQVKLNAEEQALNKKNFIPEPEGHESEEYEEPGLMSETDEEEAVGTGLKGRGKGKIRGCAILKRNKMDVEETAFRKPLTTGLTRKIGRAVADANLDNSGFTKKAIDNRTKTYPTYKDFSQEPFAPFSRGYGVNTSNSIVGRGGNMLHHGMGLGLPPALQSQPYSANYQMSHFLPPHFQHYNNSMGMQGEGIRRRKQGNGLYVGHGLFS